MEVSGQKQFKSDVKLCSFCEDFDITTCADGFCIECEIFICNKCFVKHKGRKISRDHSLVKVGESQSAKPSVDDTFETCQHHTGKLVEFYCPTHNQVCCGVCIVLNHNGCKLELVQDKAAAFKNSSDFNNVTTEITKYDQQATECAALVKINKQQLPGIYEQFVSDVNAFANEVIERVNKMKKTLLDQAKDVMLKEESKMNEIHKETEKLIADLSRQNELLVSKIDQPNKLFAASVIVKPELNKIQQQLDILQAKNIVTRYSFKRNEILESTLKRINVIGQLHEQLKTEQKEETSNEDKTNKALGPERKQLVPEKKQLVPEKKQVVPEKKQPLLERQLKCRNIGVDGDILSYAAIAHSEVGLYVDNRYVDEGDFFENEILSIGKGDSIALGLVSDDYPDNHVPGEITRSIGYRSDGKVLFDGKDRGGNGKWWCEGDRIICEIANCKSKRWRIVFIHNGKEICTYNLYPGDHFAVGMKSEGDKVKIII